MGMSKQLKIKAIKIMNNNNKDTYIAIDYDGTIRFHDYPLVGKPVPHAKEVIQELRDKGYTLILMTMRGSKSFLKDAIQSCQDDELGIEYYNDNPNQNHWTDSRKIYYHVLIDDAALGCPLIYDRTIHEKPFVDWLAVREWFINEGML